MILIPRPAPHLAHTCAALQAAGLTGILALPLSSPELIPVALPADTTAFLLTSPFSPQAGLPGLPAYCVGDTTAHAARQQGMYVVYPGTSNGAALAEDIAGLDLPPQHFTHLHGDHARLEWHTRLLRAGHTVTPVLAYRTRRIEALPATIYPFLASITHTLLFSAGSANHLANLLKRGNIQPNGTVIAFSPAVAAAASSHWPEVITAPSPTLAAMVATISRLNG